MNNFEATQTAWVNHIPDATKIVPPSVATDEELWATDEDLWKLWAEFGFAAFRIIYNLGVAHGQASSRDMPEQEAGR